MSSQSMDRDESMGIGSGRLPSMDSDSLQEIVAESRPRLERSASSGHISVQTVPEDTSERALRLRQIYEGCMNKIVEEFDQYTHKIRPPELPLATHVGMEPSMSYTASTALSTVVSMGNLERTAATGNASMLPVDRSGMTHAESSPEVNLTSKAEAPWTQALPEEEVKTGCEGCDAPRPGGSPAAAVEDMEPRSTSGLAQALSSLTTPFNRLATVGKALNRITSDTSSAPSEGPEAMSQVESRRLSALGNFAWNMGGLGRRSSAPNSPQHSPPESPRGKGQRPAEALPVEGRQPSYLVPLNVGAELLSLKVRQFHNNFGKLHCSSGHLNLL